mgnify:CR=1 FL=1
MFNCFFKVRGLGLASEVNVFLSNVQATRFVLHV